MFELIEILIIRGSSDPVWVMQFDLHC